MLENFKKILRWINEHWGAMMILGGMFWSFVTAIWVAFALPVIDGHIDKRVMLMAQDSLGTLVDLHLKEKGGFRGGFSELTGVPKDSVPYVLARAYKDGEQVKRDLDTIHFSVGYQHGFDEEVMKMLCSRQQYNGVMYFVAPTGDYYYKDDKGYIWSANYSMGDDCFYYYPPYNGNKRTKCK